MVSLHNSYRALHGVPTVAFSSVLAADAATYAAKCVGDHSGSLVELDAKNQGENL